jgi:hypothetical protein
MRSSSCFRAALCLGLCAAFWTAGCSARDRSDSAAGKPTAAAAAPKPQGEAQAAGSGAQRQCGCNEDETKLPTECSPRLPTAGHDPGCPEHGSSPVPDEVKERRDPSGRTVQHVGAEFGDAPAMTVTEALASATKLAGKPVQLEGYVSAMCEDRRAWFAIVGRDQTGDTMRVLTAPAFLVPAGAVGKQVRVEGTIDTTEVSAEMAKHLSEKHKLPAPSGESTTQTVMHATVAEFY